MLRYPQNCHRIIILFAFKPWILSGFEDFIEKAGFSKGIIQAMVLYNIDDVDEGMVVGESIFLENNRLLVAAGFRLEKQHINLLKQKGVAYVRISVEGTENIQAKSVISEQVKQELAHTINQSSSQISTIFKKSKTVKDKIEDVIKNEKKFITEYMRKSSVLKAIERAIDDILTVPWTIVNLDKMSLVSDALYTHVINVMLISLCIGHKYRYTNEEMKQLGLGVINYDIGMIAIPKEILNKTTPLTEQEKNILKQHTVYGYMMLSEISIIPPTSSIVALSHHEYQDGTGYPRGETGANTPPLKSFSKPKTIHRFAEIVAVADTFEMYIYGRKHFAQKLPPDKAIRKLIEMKGTKLNADILKTLLTIVSIYPVGMRVRVIDSPLPDLRGCYGVVAQNNPGKLFEPTILLIESRNKKKLPKPVTLDFSVHKGFLVELAD